MYPFMTVPPTKTFTLSTRSWIGSWRASKKTSALMCSARCSRVWLTRGDCHIRLPLTPSETFMMVISFSGLPSNKTGAYPVFPIGWRRKRNLNTIGETWPTRRPRWNSQRFPLRNSKRHSAAIILPMVTVFRGASKACLILNKSNEHYMHCLSSLNSDW